MVTYLFLGMLSLLAPTVFSGGCASSPSVGVRKKSQVLPECRRRIQVGPGMFIQSSKMTVVSLSEHSHVRDKYSSHHSSIGDSFEAEGSLDSVKVCGGVSSATHTSLQSRSKAYEELWFECKRKSATSYEWLRRIALNFKKFPSDDVRGMSDFETFKKLVKRHNAYTESLAPVFLGQLFQANVGTEREGLLLLFIEWQICPKCHVIYKTFRTEKLCVCGANLILPQNIDELHGLLTQAHKIVTAFLREVICFSHERGMSVASKQ